MIFSFIRDILQSVVNKLDAQLEQDTQNHIHCVTKAKLTRSVRGSYFYLWSILKTQERQCTKQNKEKSAGVEIC